MPKMVKLTDEVGSLLEERAKQDGTTIAGEIKLLLDGRDSSTLDRRLDKMARWLDKKFADLEAALDGAVLTQPVKTNRVKQNAIEWPVVQELMFTVLPEGDSAWLPGKEEAARASSDMDFGMYYTDGEKVYSDDMWGHTDWLKCTPTVLAFLTSKGVL